jgi:hypothetical protein
MHKGKHSIKETVRNLIPSDYCLGMNLVLKLGISQVYTCYWYNASITSQVMYWCLVASLIPALIPGSGQYHDPYIYTCVRTRVA